MDSKYHPIFIELIFILRVFLHRFDCKQIKSNVGNRTIIIGNGPSLLKTIDKYIDVLKKNDCFMVNNAVEHECFELIKPKYCVFADPNFFQKSTLNKYSKPVVDAFNIKLNWEMTVFLPSYAKNTIFAEELKKHPRISVAYYNSTYSKYITNFSKKRLFKYWNKNIARPLSQTVLNTASSIAIAMRYKEIYLVGADTSWIEMLSVDQNNNDIYSDDKHFYSNDKRLLYKYNENKSNLAEELRAIAMTLESYQILKEYAIYNNCQLYNASEYSLIDSLKRVHL